MAEEEFTRSDIVARARIFYNICYYSMENRQFIRNSYGYYGCDCSSFVSKCYGWSNYYSTFDMAETFRRTQGVSGATTFNERFPGIQHGDILFITAGERGKAYGHTGIYDSVNQCVIQASTTKSGTGTPEERGMLKESLEHAITHYSSYISYNTVLGIDIGIYDDETETPEDIDIGTAYGQTPQSDFNQTGLKLGGLYGRWRFNFKEYTKRYILRKGASK